MAKALVTVTLTCPLCGEEHNYGVSRKSRRLGFTGWCPHSPKKVFQIEGEKMNEDKMVTIEYDEHVWEVGYFGEKRNGFNAYGFRQDGIVIRVTSKYEAEVFKSFLVKAAAEEVKDLPDRVSLRYKLDENIIEEFKNRLLANINREESDILEEISINYGLTKEIAESIEWYAHFDIISKEIREGRLLPPKRMSRKCTNWECEEFEKP